MSCAFRLQGFISQLRETRDARYLTLLTSLCVVGGVAVEGNQDLIVRSLLSDEPRNAPMFVGLRSEDHDNREFVVDWCAAAH